MSSVIQLREYQKEAIKAIEKSKHKRMLAVLPTGMGKTVVFSSLIQMKNVRTLVIAHRKELLHQAKSKILDIYPEADVGIVQAKQDGFDSQIVVASIQTLTNATRLNRIGHFDLIIVDEAHHVAAKSYRKILEKLGAFKKKDGPMVVGFTATPDRGDEVGLNCVFQEIVYQKDILWGIKESYLSDLTAKQIKLKADFSQLKVSAGDFSNGQLSTILMDANGPELIVKAYLKHALERKGIVFTPTVDVAERTAEAFIEAGISAVYLSGKTPEKEREQILKDFDIGTIQVVANCGVLTEGFDQPDIGCVVIARPTRSRSLYVQMIGRGTRKYPTKRDCLVLDLVGTANRHDLVTTASLFGLAPKDLDGKTVTRAKKEAEERDPFNSPVNGELVSIDVNPFERTNFNWLSVNANQFTIPFGKGQIIMYKEDGKWVAVAHYSKEHQQILARNPSIEVVQGVAEDFIRQQGAANLVKKDAKWRMDPATLNQKRLLRKLNVEVPIDITKGQASDLIEQYVARSRTGGGGVIAHG